MTYRLEKLPDEPIVLITCPQDFRVGPDVPAATEFDRLMEAEVGQVYLLIDVTEFRVGIDDMLSGASLAAGGDTSLFHKECIRKILIISPSSLVAMSARGMNSRAFGYVPIDSCATMEDALAYVREDLQVGDSV